MALPRRAVLIAAHIAALTSALALFAGCSPVTPPETSERTSERTGEAAARPTSAEVLAEVLADPRRDADRARDAWRHPQETLEFFGVTPTMTVAEVYPGGGWYTRILVPYVGEKGGYLGIEYSRLTHERLAEEPALGSVSDRIDDFIAGFADEARAYGPPDSNVLGGVAFDEIPSDLYGKVDAVVFVRALHNLKRTGTLAGALAETYALLKPGGVIGVVQHRAPPTASDAYASGEKGYLKVDDVVAAFEAAGFVLEDSSEINANPNDPANWPNGVWTLPPELTLGLLNQDRYRAVGESDRMTLRFRKPGGLPLGG